jgi:hypothetical protein
MTPLRTFWVAWCSLWAAFWLLAGFFTIIGWAGVPLSLLAILLPVGNPPKPLPWRCLECGQPPSAHPYGQACRRQLTQ